MTLPKINMPPSWVLPIAFLLFLIPLFLIEFPLWQLSKGEFVYPQDEAYIRMATAKNLAFHGNWGLTSGIFSAGSSSILYPLLLAMVYKFLGAQLFIPIVINLLTALVLIIQLQRWLRNQGTTPLDQVLILAAVILLAPLPVLVAGGMEHMLQVLFTFLFLTKISLWLTLKGSETAGRRDLPWTIYLLALLLTTTRYEGLFLVLIACMALLLKKRYLLSLTLGLVAILPLILFGILSLQKDAFFLPTSIMIKALPVPLNGETIHKLFTEDLLNRLIYPANTQGSIATTRLLFVLPLVYWLSLRQMREQPLYRNILLFCLAMTCLHLAFANAVNFFRYEAYLITAAAFSIGVLIAKNGGAIWPAKSTVTRWVILWSVLFLVYPFFARAWSAYTITKAECLNTYEQSFQAAKFIHTYYDNATVITDDIGTTSYLCEGKQMDLLSGITYTEIARGRIENYYRLEYVEYLVKLERPTLAFVAENRYGYPLRQHWTKVADWYTNNTTALRDNHISFYALDTAAVPRLKKELQQYEPLLPKTTKALYP
jgi:hypothetical protein